MIDFSEEIRLARLEHVRLLDELVDSELAQLERLAQRSADTLRGGGKLLLFGNGGSAAQAQHLAAEFVNRYEMRRQALAAIALTADGSVLTSVANDSDPLQIFSRQVEALARRRDLVIGISTSGVSPNVVEGLRAARRLGVTTAALLGREGGAAGRLADLAVLVRGTDTARIQEVHLFAGHLLCRWVEHLLELKE